MLKWLNFGLGFAAAPAALGFSLVLRTVGMCQLAYSGQMSWTGQLCASVLATVPLFALGGKLTFLSRAVSAMIQIIQTRFFSWTLALHGAQTTGSRLFGHVGSGTCTCARAVALTISCNTLALQQIKAKGPQALGSCLLLHLLVVCS